ncbi:MAG: leucine-rich repeat domain-containing protein [Proteobacteria bacterium]|nr:leucine-rich repeat domain-containing protein [Pseudomonadota bacterium]
MDSKKILLVLFSLIFAQACTDAPDTSESQAALECLSFYDSTFAVYALTHWDIDRNGCLSQTEAAQVTEIPSNAFTGNTSLQNLNDLHKFPNLTVIGNSAFSECTGLVSIDLPNIQTVGDKAFANCTNLVSVLLPNASSIRNNAFEGCTSLTNIVGPQTQNTCTGGMLKCSDDNAQVLICMNNQWMTKEACANGCSNGACISAQTPKTCTKGTLKCSNDNTKVQLCKNNSWTTLANCPDGCTNGACITHKPAKTCAEGALKCSDDNTHVLVCANDTWLTKETCDHGCTNGVCVTDIPAPTCNEGALKCSDDNKQALVCSNGAWIIKEYCAGGCADGACVVAPEPTCTNGMHKCSDDGTQALACRQNQWTVIETCTDGCVGGGCIISGPKTDDNHNHMNDAYETAPNQGKGDGFCDSFIDYKCSTKCTSDDQCVDDDEFHYICRPDGRCAPDTFTFVINIKKNEDNDYRFSLDTDYISDCNFTIDWGDGSRIKKYESKTALPLDDMGNFSHNYLVPGIYTVKIKGKYDGFKIANDESFLVVSEDGDASYYMSYYIVEIKSFGPVGLGRWGAFALEDYRNLNKLSQVDIPDASKLTSLHKAFSPDYEHNLLLDHVEPLFNAPLNNWVECDKSIPCFL